MSSDAVESDAVESVAVEEGAAPASVSAPVVRDSSKSGVAADRVVTLIAKPGLWPLDADAARRVLQALGPVTREQPTPNDMSLVGGVDDVGTFDVDYSLDEGRYWVFETAGFFLGGADRARLYHGVAARLGELLGRPAWTNAEAGTDELPAVGWDLGEAVTLSLAPSTDGEEQGIKIAIRESSEDD